MPTAVAMAAPGATLALANSWSGGRTQVELLKPDRIRSCCCQFSLVSVSYRSRNVPGGTRWRVACEATNDGDYDRMSKMAEEAKRKAADAAKTFTSKAEEVLNDAKRKAWEFQKTNDLKGKAAKAARQANQRLEEISYDVRKKAVRWDREYGFSDKAQRAKEYAQEQMQNLDRQLNVRQKVRNFQSEFQLSWPTYRRQLNSFLDTSLGKAVATLFFAWFVLSGWFFRIFFYSVWLLPLAAPLLIGSLSRNLIEGACPACGTRYVGTRNQVVVCQRCRGIVWQPRQDFSRDKTVDPTIIDVDLDDK